MTKSFVAPELQGKLGGERLFEAIDRLEGEIYRQVDSRRTIKTRIGDEYYFAKIHFGVGWPEIFKNLLSGRLPVLGASNELHALRKLEEIGVDSLSPVAFCEEGINPAKKRSAILTRALEGMISLEDYRAGNAAEKFRLTIQLARVARRMHGAGINHRDFYLCHFLLDEEEGAAVECPRLHVIDLHRAQIRSTVPRRWLVKDLGGLLFSALDHEPSQRDLMRFAREYAGSLRTALADRRFWRDVLSRVRKLYLQDHDDAPDFLDTLIRRL